MKVFPVDSMITGTGKDGLPEYDRAYKSVDMRSVFSAMFTDGVFMDYGDALRVQAGSGLQVIVGKGTCNIQGAFGYETEQRTLNLQAAEATLDRIDTVVARLNLNINSRSCELYVRQGTPAQSPKAPDLQRDATIWELGLANVFVPAQAGSISQQRITDTRLLKDRCGAVTPVVSIDVSKAAQQVEDQVQKNLEIIEAAVDGTTAGKLQTAIDENKSSISQNKADADKELLALSAMLTPKSLYGDGSYTNWHVVQIGKLVYVLANGIRTGKGSWDYTSCPYTLPQELRPKNDIYTQVVTQNGGSVTGTLKVATTGVITVQNLGSTGSTDYRFGSLVFPVFN